MGVTIAQWVEQSRSHFLLGHSEYPPLNPPITGICFSVIQGIHRCTALFSPHTVTVCMHVNCCLFWLGFGRANNWLGQMDQEAV